MIAFVLVLPLAACERMARGLLHHDVLFNAHAELLSMAPGRFGSFLRTAYYHRITHRCPLTVTIGFGSMFTHSEIELGERVYIGSRCVLGMTKIGDNTMISDHCHILSGGRQHGTDRAKRFQEQPGVFTPVNIGTNCWIGVNCVIFDDVGENSIVGAGSVVSRAIPQNVTVVGSPARVVESAERTATSL